MGIQVEVCIQDCFAASKCWESETSLSTSDDSNPASYLISSETWSSWFHCWLEMIQPRLSAIGAYELSLRLTGDREIQTLNAQYRQQNQPTDVLAFATLEMDCPQPDNVQASLPLYLGDIIISVDTAQQQAQAQGHSLQTELAWLASHGLLHLLGWDHPDDESLSCMLSKQRNLLHTVGLSTTSG